MVQEHVVSSCGRICLIGEHTDWASEITGIGQAIVFPTDQMIEASVEKLHTRDLVVESDGKVYRSSLNQEDLLREAVSDSFFSYIAGVSYVILERFPQVDGVQMNCKSSLPIRKGLSSSAAICRVTAKSFNILSQLNLNDESTLR